MSGHELHDALTAALARALESAGGAFADEEDLACAVDELIPVFGDTERAAARAALLEAADWFDMRHKPHGPIGSGVAAILRARADRLYGEETTSPVAPAHEFVEPPMNWARVVGREPCGYLLDPGDVFSHCRQLRERHVGAAGEGTTPPAAPNRFGIEKIGDREVRVIPAPLPSSRTNGEETTR